MAKIFDRLKSRLLELRLIKKRQGLEWTQTEIEELPQMTERKTDEKLGKRVAQINSRLKKSAFAACDKSEYIDSVHAEKLRKYDMRTFMRYRAVNHAAAKAIFAATDDGARAEAFQTQSAGIAEIERKRAEYVKTLDEKKREFLQKHPSADSTEYDALKAKYEAEYSEYEAKLRADGEARMNARLAKLNAKREKYAAAVEDLKSKIKSEIELPDDVLLRVEGLKMYFGGLKAVDDLTFDVKNGEIFGLIGPNGAGKTTVFNCITRFYNATGGNMYFNNKHGEAVDLRRFQVHDVILQGVSRTFQNVELVRELSVLDNLLVACTRNYRSNLFVQALGLPILKKEDNILKSKAMGILKFMDLESYAFFPAMGLPYGILKKVEIARALMANPKLLILDEPAAGLNNTETAQLSKLIVDIRDKFGCAVFLVEHDMSLVMSICDRICAISFGKMLALGEPEVIQSNKQVQDAYLGTGDE